MGAGLAPGVAADPNLILDTAKAPQLNPLGMMGQITDIAHTASQNKLLQQQVGTNQAVADAMKASMDPDTGQPDMATMMAKLKADPRAQYDMPGVMKGITDYAQSQLNLAASHIQITGGQISSLLGLPVGGLSSNKPILEGMGKLLADGIISPQDFADLSKQLPPEGEQYEPERRSFLTLQLNNSLDQKTKVEAMLGQFNTYNTGQQIQMGTAGPEHGFQPSGNLSMGMSPAEANAPTQTGVDPQGRPIYGTRQQFVTEATGGAPQGGVGATGAAGTGAAVGAPSGAPQAVQAGPPGVVMGLGPAQEAAKTAAGQEFGNVKTDVDTRVQAGQQLVMRMQESLKAMQDYGTGANAQLRGELAQEAQKWGAPQNIVDAIAGGNLGAMQEFNKFAVQQATEALKQTLGANRIALMEFNTFQKANPNLSTDPRAIQKMYAFANKLYSYDLAEQTFMADYMDKGGDPAQFENAWAREAARQGLVSSSAIAAATNPNRAPPGRNQPAPAITPTKGAPAHRKSLDEIFQ